MFTVDPNNYGGMCPTHSTGIMGSAIVALKNWEEVCSNLVLGEGGVLDQLARAAQLAQAYLPNPFGALTSFDDSLASLGDDEDSEVGTWPPKAA